ncbi:MAG: FAD binding domain-containing protein [Anaerolineae bacterium]
MAITKAAVEYHFPQSVDEAIHLLQHYGARARIIAGGTDLLLRMEAEGYRPQALVDITRIPALKRIEVQDGQVFIGSAVTYSELLDLPSLAERVPFLIRAIRTIGGVQVRNMATLVGNITNASPAGDTLPCLYVLNAEVHINGPRGERSLPIEQFILGVRRTALAPAEIVTHVTFPLPTDSWFGVFEKLGLRRAMAISVVSAAVMLGTKGGQVAEARCALGAVAPTVIRVPTVERYLEGRALDDEIIEQAGRYVVQAARPIDDIRGSARYRAEAAAALVRRALRHLRDQIVGRSKSCLCWK